MKVIPMAGALIMLMLLAGSISVVAADSTDADYTTAYDFIVDDYDEIPDDDYVDDDDTTDNDTDNEQVVYLRGRGTLFAMGNGHAVIRGTGVVLIFAEEANVIVSSNAWVRALGDWNVQYLGNGKVKYTGSGVLQIRGHRMTVDISGNGISLKASGRGSVTLCGNWDYWVIHWPRAWCCRPRPWCCVGRPAIATRVCCQNSVLPVEYASGLELPIETIPAGYAPELE